SGALPAAFAAGLTLALAAALLIDAGSAYESVQSLVVDPQVACVVIGGLAAVFVSGSMIGWLLAPVANRIEQKPPGFVNAGRYIGWLERTLVFGFIVAGEPAAAAVTLTAKSVARFPTFSSGQEALAEYVLIGTLLSFLVAAAGAVAVRAALGLPAM
ncbi:MAG TPA: hypothetical protein VN238_22040, partial [Solirubrobacteraceae bacterium]|nr:hypothetical protein [Solirubrobacteraceae bacterium]